MKSKSTFNHPNFRKYKEGKKYIYIEMKNANIEPMKAIENDILWFDFIMRFDVCLKFQ